LSLHLKDLDTTWRVFTTSGGGYADILSMATGGGASKVFTKGQTVTMGTELFLVAYKVDGPDIASIIAGGGPPKPKALTGNTVLRLSLLNLHALSSMDGIKVFDLKEVTTPAVTAGIPESPPAPTTAENNEPALLKNGAAAPDFTVRDDKDNPVKLSAYRGKVVVLDFWATWCGPCQESLPGTNKIAKQYSGKGVVFLGVNVWDKKTDFHNWLPSHKSLDSIRFAIDTRGQGEDVATKLYHVSGIPTQYIVDRKGHIVASTVGYSEDEAELKAGIKTALGQ